MKFPWMQFMVNDWLCPEVGLCQPATRGIWMDWLCQMHRLDRCGLITGTREELAVLGRCTVVQVDAALTDLIRTKTADVTFRNDVVTVVNRRMRRDYLARKNGAIRVHRHRSNVACNASVTGHKSESESESEGKGERVSVSRDPGAASPPSSPLEKLQGWQLRKDLRETTDPKEIEAIKAEMRRRSVANRKPATPSPEKPKPPVMPLEKRQELWRKTKEKL
jgi:hypothetical protein